VIKSGYKVDLSALHALCEANYARLLRLFPDYESCNNRQFSVGQAKIYIEVLERSRYTTVFRLRCYRASATQGAAGSDVSGRPDADSERAGWLTPLKLEARAYHDAGMLEVIAFQSGGRTQGRYSYPNPSMLQQDEKRQQNSFLADWLSHCLHHGEAEVVDFLMPGEEHA